MNKIPLNGTKTHALSDFAISKLRELENKTCPKQEFNNGLANRLLRESLVEIVMLPSPFKTHNKKSLAHLAITEAGRNLIANND